MNIFAELKRRNVLRMALLYLGAAWLVLQVVDVLIDRGPLPESLGPITLTLLTIGFPIALALSWFYEITPSGVALDEDVEPGAALPVAGRRVDFIIIAVMGAAILMFAYDKWWTGPPPERSIAVLPFVNMTADEESDHLGTGIAETVLNMLAQTPDLHVISATSSFQSRLDGLSMPEIAGLLGVATLLEGSVQRHGNRLRITAQLIDAENDAHLWSRNFDRDDTDVFTIQDEIAEAVTSALELSLRSETKQRIDREDTDNLEAFEEYSRAIENLRVRTTESEQQAVKHLQRAVELDPDFALAHAALGRAYLTAGYYVWSGLSEEEVLARARQHANTALRIAPGLSTALILLGVLSEDIDARGQLYREAVDNAPNDTLALRAYASYLFFEKFQFDEATALNEKVIRLDPLDEANYGGLAARQVWRNQPRACLETISRGLDKIPESVALRDGAALCHWVLGEYRSAIVSEYETLRFDPQDYVNRGEIGILYLLSGMPDEAERWLDSAAAHAPEGHYIRHLKSMPLDVYYQRNDEMVFSALRQFFLEHGNSWIISNYFAMSGGVFIEYGAKLNRLDEVLATFEELYPHLFAEPPDLETASSFWEDTLPLEVTALALLRSGDARRGGPMMRAFREKAEQWDRELFVDLPSVGNLLALGETEAALEKFRDFAAQSDWIISLMSITNLRHGRLYDPIRDEPEFIALLEAFDKNAAEQRKLLQAMDLPIR